MNDDHRARYPLLFVPVDARWQQGRVRYVFEPEPPSPEMISNVRMIGFVEDRVLVIDTEEFGWSAAPGGTLEPGETYLDALDRELLEEAGARVLSYEVFGRFHFLSEAEQPYRPHLPHPESHWAVGYGDVAIVGAPTQPEGGERVRHVVFASVDDAVEMLTGEGAGTWRELIRLADELRRARR